jgi:hypothetical protein
MGIGRRQRLVWRRGLLKTVNLAARAADFTDADCNAANAAAVIGAMHGMKAIPQHLVAQLGERIVGAEMGGVKLNPPVDEKISELAQRTAAVGEKVFAANGGSVVGETLIADLEPPKTQPAELFKLGDLDAILESAWTSNGLASAERAAAWAASAAARIWRARCSRRIRATKSAA